MFRLCFISFFWNCVCVSYGSSLWLMKNTYDNLLSIHDEFPHKSENKPSDTIEKSQYRPTFRGWYNKDEKRTTTTTKKQKKKRKWIHTKWNMTWQPIKLFAWSKRNTHTHDGLCHCWCCCCCIFHSSYLYFGYGFYGNIIIIICVFNYMPKNIKIQSVHIQSVVCLYVRWRLNSINFIDQKYNDSNNKQQTWIKLEVYISFPLTFIIIIIVHIIHPFLELPYGAMV